MNRVMVVWCCAPVAICAGTGCAVQAPATKQVNPHWLAQNADNEGVVTADIGSDLMQYWAGHIPGAVYQHFESLCVTQDGVAGRLLPARMLAMILGRLGVNRKSTVIVYGDDDAPSATYFIWALDSIGHESSALLVGGHARWGKEGRPVSQDYPQVRSCR